MPSVTKGLKVFIIPIFFLQITLSYHDLLIIMTEV